MKKFEYKTYLFNTAKNAKSYDEFSDLNHKMLERLLNELGEKGWELIETVRKNALSGEISKLLLIFKREK